MAVKWSELAPFVQEAFDRVGLENGLEGRDDAARDVVADAGRELVERCARELEIVALGVDRALRVDAENRCGEMTRASE